MTKSHLLPTFVLISQIPVMPHVLSTPVSSHLLSQTYFLVFFSSIAALYNCFQRGVFTIANRRTKSGYTNRSMQSAKAMVLAAMLHQKKKTPFFYFVCFRVMKGYCAGSIFACSFLLYLVTSLESHHGIAINFTSVGLEVFVYYQARISIYVCFILWL